MEINIVHGKAFIDHLVEIGVLPKASTHVIIEARVGEPLVRVYYEVWGETNLLRIDPAKIDEVRAVTFGPEVIA